uniref:Uncharacterized protein n=1 Tax=Helicotheca tamesis TaxID=374047 RepID=A0A7S2GTA4_9STRA
MNADSDCNVASSGSMDWGIDMIEPLNDEMLEKEDLLMLDCFDAEELDGWLQKGTDGDMKEGKDTTSATKEEGPGGFNEKLYHTRRGSMPKRSLSPPAKRQHRMDDQAQAPASFSAPQTADSLQSPQAPIHPQYNEMIEKLAQSMRRSEQSRARIIQLRSSSSSSERQSPPIPPTQSSTMSSLAGFLSGKTPSLTAGLEQSRKQVRAYMGHINTNSL